MLKFVPNWKVIVSVRHIGFLFDLLDILDGVVEAKEILFKINAVINYSEVCFATQYH